MSYKTKEEIYFQRQLYKCESLKASLVDITYLEQVLESLDIDSIQVLNEYRRRIQFLYDSRPKHPRMQVQEQVEKQGQEQGENQYKNTNRNTFKQDMLSLPISEFKSKKTLVIQRNSQSLHAQDTTTRNKENTISDWNTSNSQDSTNQKVQDDLSLQLSKKAQELKQSTRLASELLQKDSLVLNEAQEELERNVTRVERSRRQIGSLSNSSWTTTLLIWMSILVVICTFIGTFLFMRLWKPRIHYPIEVPNDVVVQDESGNREFVEGWLW